MISFSPRSPLTIFTIVSLVSADWPQAQKAEVRSKQNVFIYPMAEILR